MSEANRRRVTRAQLESLWVFLSCHRNVAVGFNKSLEDREKSRRLWMRVAQNINGLNGGGVRNWKGWAKYWVDYKAKLRKRASQINTNQNGEKVNTPLTDIEKKFLALLSPKMQNNLPAPSQAEDLENMTSDSFDEIANFKENSTVVLEKLVDVLKDIHKVLARIEEKLPSPVPHYPNVTM